MKKIPWLILILIIILPSASEPGKLVQLTIINKAEMPIAVQLVSVFDSNQFYYLPVEEGDRENPETKTYTITSELYNMQVYYIETYDPVYGFRCGRTLPNRLLAAHNLKVVILPCYYIPTRRAPTDLNRDGIPDRVPNLGEPTMRKYIPFPIIHPLCPIAGIHCNWYGTYRFIY